MPEYARFTVDSPNLLKRWLHRQRFEASCRLLDLADGQRFLDYGCGDGELSLRISRRFPASSIVAFDPVDENAAQARKKLADCRNATVTQDLSAVTGEFDRIACLETIEHLPAAELEALFSDIRRTLKTGGKCLFTFPLEHGFAALAKNAYRMISKSDRFASVGRTARSVLGQTVEREPTKKLGDSNYIYSHIGFDPRKMRQTLAENFEVIRVRVLPAGFVPFGLGNSVAVLAAAKAAGSSSVTDASATATSRAA